MGKTVGGALWLDAEKLSPYDFYQYLRNVADADVKNCLSLLTFLPMEEVNRLAALKDSAINEAKVVLATEVTTLVHGEEAAMEARRAAEALFSGGGLDGSVPTTVLTGEQLSQNRRIVDLMVLCGLAKSKGDARRLIQGGGVYANGEVVASPDAEAEESAFAGEGLMLRKGKKTYHNLVLR
jgi:tyrosyl-tRNA synthetase